METYTLPKATLQQVLQKHPAAIRSFENTHVQKVLNRLQVCRTAALGYHAYQCTSEDSLQNKVFTALKLMIVKGDVLLPTRTDTVAFFNLLYKKAWVVYAKAPFGGPHTVIEYLGR